MRVKKSIDMSDNGRCQDLIWLFGLKLASTCGVDTAAYKNNMESFEQRLQEIVDQAFKLGQEDKK